MDFKTISGIVLIWLGIVLLIYNILRFHQVNKRVEKIKNENSFFVSGIASEYYALADLIPINLVATMIFILWHFI